MFDISLYYKHPCSPHLTVQAKEDQHHEEETSPKWRQRHHSYSFGVCNECKTRTCMAKKRKILFTTATKKGEKNKNRSNSHNFAKTWILRFSALKNSSSKLLLLQKYSSFDDCHASKSNRHQTIPTLFVYSFSHLSSPSITLFNNLFLWLSLVFYLSFLSYTRMHTHTKALK